MVKNIPYSEPFDSCPQFLAIKDELKKVCLAIGISQIPDQLQTEALIKFIIQFYGYFELHEISKAFDLASAGRFYVGKDNEGLKHFNNLSKKYIGEVFMAYIKYKNQLPKQPRQELIAIGDSLQNERALYDNDRELWMRNCIIDAFYNFKEKYTPEKTKGKISTLNYQYVEWLWKNNFVFRPSGNGYEFYKQKALSESMIQDKRGNIVSTMEHPDGTAKRLLITDWFIELIEQGRTLLAIERTLKITEI